MDASMTMQTPYVSEHRYCEVLQTSDHGEQSKHERTTEASCNQNGSHLMSTSSLIRMLRQGIKTAAVGMPSVDNLLAICAGCWSGTPFTCRARWLQQQAMSHEPALNMPPE